MSLTVGLRVTTRDVGELSVPEALKSLEDEEVAQRDRALPYMCNVLDSTPRNTKTNRITKRAKLWKMGGILRYGCTRNQLDLGNLSSTHSSGPSAHSSLTIRLS